MPKHSHRFLIVMILLVGLTGFVAPFVSPAAAQSGPAVGFADSQTTVTQGDVAAIDLQLRNTDRAVLRIRSADQEYQATLRVRDNNDDGVVRIHANTFDSPNVEDNKRYTANREDSARLVAESDLPDANVLNTGRYNLIVSTGETSVAAVLTVDTPDTNGSGINVIAPDKSSDSSNVNIGNNLDRNTTTETEQNNVPISVARGDHVRTRFAVTGYGGVLEFPAPAHNQVFPDDSAPGVQTTHTAQTTPNESISAKSLTIDYGVDGSTPPVGVHQLSPDKIDAIGLDETGDGYIDNSTGNLIQSIQTSTDGSITITFDRPIEISEDHTLRMAYAMQNPDLTGPQDVSVILHGEQRVQRDHGTVLYGPAGQGTLGYGVDLRLTAVEGDAPTAPLAAIEPTYNANTGGLVTTTDTSTLATGEYAMTFAIGEAAPDPVPRVSMRESFAVVEPSANFINRTAGDDSRLSVTADTNLASGSSVIIRVAANKPNGGISQVLNCVATVDSNGSVNCEFDLSRSADNFEIKVTIQRNNSIISGPVEFN